MTFQFTLALVGSALLAISLGLPYMKVVEKQGWPEGAQAPGLISLVAGIVILAVMPYIPGV